MLVTDEKQVCRLAIAAETRRPMRARGRQPSQQGPLARREGIAGCVVLER